MLAHALKGEYPAYGVVFHVLGYRIWKRPEAWLAEL
jgi:hypothetical protein